MLKVHRLSVSILCVSFSLVLNGCKKDAENQIGTSENPLKVFFVPADDTQSISNNADQLRDFLTKFISQRLYKKDNGFYITTSIPSSYIAVVEAFGTKRADLAAINSYSYYLLKDVKKYPAEAILNILRGDHESTYKAQFIARADSGINKIADLKGKRFAFSDPASTSGFILPSLMLNEKEIDLTQKVFAGRHDNVVTMVYQKQVDAGATYYSPPTSDGKIMDARMRVFTQFPDVEKKIKIIGFSEEIPNAPWVLRTDIFGKDAKLYAKVKLALQEGFEAFSHTAEGKKALLGLYSITGVVKASDEDFASTRKLFSKAELAGVLNSEAK